MIREEIKNQDSKFDSINSRIDRILKNDLPHLNARITASRRDLKFWLQILLSSSVMTVIVNKLLDFLFP